jgi:hypothetical protein
MRRKKPLPEAIKNAPRLHVGLDIFYFAYGDLQGDRGGMGDGRIPWTAVQAYCLANDFEPDLIEDCHHYVQAMDDAWHEYQRAKRDRENAAGRR